MSDVIKSTRIKYKGINMQEYDLVKAKFQLSNSVEKGCEGTILMILSNNPNVYLVEFFDENDNTIEVLTASENGLYTNNITVMDE